MEYILDFLNNYGATIIMGLLTAIAGFLGAQIKKLYEKFVNDKTKKAVVETCVKAVEQLYKDLSGAEKLEKAKENILQMLNEKGLTISDVELDMLIESVVAEFNVAFRKNKKEEIEQ